VKVEVIWGVIDLESRGVGISGATGHGLAWKQWGMRAFVVAWGGGGTGCVGEESFLVRFHCRPCVRSERRRIRALKISCCSSISFPVSARRQFRLT
jgi:hypothetical protein